MRRIRLSEIMQSDNIPEQLHKKEKLFLACLHQAATDLFVPNNSYRLGGIKNYKALEAELHEVWTEIELFAPEYISLRRGDVADFAALQKCIHLKTAVI